MGQYLGLAPLGSNFPVTVLVGPSYSNQPKNVDSGGGPNYRVYGPAGLMNNGTGTATQKESGSVTGATNAGPIVVTSANHGLTTGTRVTIAGVLGNTAANGDCTVTVIDANTFSLNGSTGNGSYTSGGTWNTTGLYALNVLPQATDGYASGQTYSVLITATVGGVVVGQLHSLTCV